MVKRTQTRKVDKSQAGKYALLAIHAAISYSDALSIAYGGIKSTDDHAKAVDALRSVLGAQLMIARAKELLKILLEKDAVSYQGSYYTLEEGQRILAVAESYCAWARRVFEGRPA